jgi:hypothetical protein
MRVFENGIVMGYSKTCKPKDRNMVESFIRSFRDESLKKTGFCPLKMFSIRWKLGIRSMTSFVPILHWVT